MHSFELAVMLHKPYDTKSMKDYIKDISIRGRFAIGLTCLKKKLRAENIHWKEEIHIVLEKYAKFTNSNKLDIWETEIKFYGPSIEQYKNGEWVIELINGENNKIKDYNNNQSNYSKYYDGISIEIETPEIYTDLIKFYRVCNKDIKRIIELCENIGTNNLYVGTDNHSQETLSPLMEILDILELQSEFDFKAIANVYPFKYENGWGQKFEFKTFRK